MYDTASIMWGVLFGAIGMAYMAYGKKQRRGIALLSGVLLCVLPYFASNAFFMILIAVIVIALPYFLRY